MSFFGIPIRNGLPIGLGSKIGFGSRAFSPASLFAAGEQGAWYDPSDFSTLFQNSAGTTPVTAVEQPVGLMLDKSKNAIGTNGAKRVNLLTRTEEFNNAVWTNLQSTETANATTSPDGTTTADAIFETAVTDRHGIYYDNAASIAPWSANTNQTFSVFVKNNGRQYFYLYATSFTGADINFIYAIADLVNGTITDSGSGGISSLSSSSITSAGNGWYRVSISGILHNTANTAYCLCMGSNVSTKAAATILNGCPSYLGDITKGFYLWGADLRLASEASTLPTYQRITDTWYNTFAGNHAFQATPTSRPSLSARVNLLTKTEQFDDAAWTKTRSSVTANAIVAPDGTLTADKLVEDTTASNSHLVLQSPTVISGIPYTHSVYLKAGERTWAVFQYGNAYAWVNLATGQLGTQVAVAIFSVTSVGNGWYRCAVTWVTNITNPPAAVYTATGDNVLNYTGDGASGIYVWGADLRSANDGVGLLAYQRVNTATDYDTTGFPLYLQYDGSNDGFLTNSVDFATVTSDGQARRNLLTFPTAFNDAVWVNTNTTVTANAAAAPDGTTTADKLIASAVTNIHVLHQVVTTAAVSNVYSIYAKSAGYDYVQLLTGLDGSSYQNFDLALGVIGNGTGGTASIENVGNGWYRCVWTKTDTAGANEFRICPLNADTATRRPSFLGDGTSGVFLWGAQLEVGSTATAFQNIGTDAMSVFAGLRKLSDVAEAVVVELSATVASNNGTFRLAAPHAAATSSYEFESKGTTMRDAIADNYGAPMTNVISGLANISGDSVTIRVNSMLEETEIADQGSGNFGNYPLYIGRRNNASLPFNGRMYSLIILGRGVTTQQLDQVENYVEQKTFGRSLTLTYVDPILTAASEEITMPDGEQIFMSVTYQ